MKHEPRADGALVQVGDARTDQVPGARRSMLARAAQGLSTVAVVATLGVAAYWGHETGWRFVRVTAGADTRVTSEEGIAVVRTGHAAAPDGRLPPSLRQPVSIEFPSAGGVDRAGIDIAPAWRSGMTEQVVASGEVSFEPTRLARLSARAPGTVWRVMKTVGDPVKAGDVLALVDATDVGKAKAEFQQALVQARLKKTALEQIGPTGGAVPAAKRREVEAAVKDTEVRLLGAEQALHNLGLSVKASDYERLALDEVVRLMRLTGVPESINGLTSETASANLLPVRAPMSGVLLSVDVVGGEVVDASRVLFVVVDPSRMWLTLHVGPEDARRVKLSQPVTFRADGGGGEVPGRVAWIGAAADETTRTIPVRAELANDDGRLRASTLGRGRIVIREAPDAVVVPAEAVHAVDGAKVVFVRDRRYLSPDGPKAFHVRPVAAGATDGPNVEIVSGLVEGEVVATKGSRVLVSELARHAAQSGRSR